MPNRSVLERWFEKIDTDIAFLRQCFAEVLLELGEEHLAASLPWHTASPDDATPPDSDDENIDGELQMYSIAYHLLNLVEENAAEAQNVSKSEFLRRNFDTTNVR